MNERIKELAREAGLLAYNPGGVPTKLEKFAELIVEECKNLLFESSENNRLPITVDDMNHIIDTHFGIK
jgi:hypothetical protein